MIKRTYKKHRNLILYGIIGGTSAGIDFGLFTLLTLMNVVPYLWANVFGVVTGITISFFLNAFFNFKQTNKLIVRFVIFYSVGLTGLLLSTGLMYLSVDVFGLYEIVSKVLANSIVVAFQYLMNSKITFDKKVQT